ncbi:MAG TPA: hypothetical protein VLT47_11645 [Anaeromyxobacteraceae bacterium]|nr:hypothetical protein [Anaeromyxobacteraceae bacterium]
MAMLAVFAVRSVLRASCLEELVLDVAGATGMLFGLGATLTALLARAVQGLRPRQGLALACKGLGWANLVAAGAAAANLLYAWNDGDLRDGLPLSISFGVTLTLALWLARERSTPMPPASADRSKWRWLLLVAGAILFVSYAGAAFWSANRDVSVPPFDVEVQLTDAASQKLEAAGETIKVAIYFDGDGRRRRGEETAPFRDVFLGSHEVELHQQGRIRITDARISKEAIGRLSDPNYHFFINVVSGRRAFKDNVLGGGYADGRMTDLNPAQPIVVRCRAL